jgi:hypothetical protein
MPGHSRSKNGVATLAYGAGHPRLIRSTAKDVDGRDKPTSVRLEMLSDSNDSSSQSWIESANEYYELEPLQALVRTPDFSNRTAVGLTRASI